MTEDNLRNVKPPKDVVVELRGFAADLGLEDWSKVKEDFYTILEEPFFNDMEIKMEDRCRQASKILLAQYAEKFSSHTEKMEFAVIEKTPVKEIKRKPKNGEELPDGEEKTYLSSVFGIFAGHGDSELRTKPGILNLWGDACQSLKNFEVGKAYIGNFGVEEYENYYSLSASDSAALEESNMDIPRPRDIVPKFFPVISVRDAEFNLSSDKSDLKLLKGRVRSGRTGLTGAGDQMGFLTLIDDTASLKDIKRGENASATVIFFDSPEFATRYATGSELYVICEIQASEKYGLSIIGRFIIPIMAIPTKPKTRPIKRKPTPKPEPEPEEETLEENTDENAIPEPEDVDGW